MDDKPPGVSNDITALRDVVDMPVDLNWARWKIFGTPEHTAGVPGPTDYITRVAELELAPPSAAFAAADHGSVEPGTLARLYRIISTSSAGASHCWVSEEVFLKLMQASDPKSAWR